MIIIPFIIIYLTFIVIFLRIRLSKKDSSTSNELKISLIIAAKNEEENLPLLIDSLQKQNYSPENYEVIIIDDNSEDLTYSVGKTIIEDIPNFRIYKAQEKKYAGKRGALQLGIDQSSHDVLLFTDADCQPNSGFLLSYSNKFYEGKDLIFGISPLKQNNSLINKIICYDNLWVHILSFSFANIGLPYSASGRSFGIRKAPFNKIGGYKNTLDTLSGDDDLLLREALKYSLPIGIILNKNAFVYSEGKKNFKDFLYQRSRHTTTSNYYSPKIKFTLGVWHLLNLLMLFSPAFVLINQGFVILFFIKVLVEIITVKSLMKIFDYQFSTIDILGLLIYHQFLLVAFYVGSFLRNKKW